MKKLRRETPKKTQELSSEEKVIILERELLDVKQVLNDMLLSNAK